MVMKMDQYNINGVFHDTTLKKDLEGVLKGVDSVSVHVSDYVDIMIEHHFDDKGAVSIVNIIEKLHGEYDELWFVNPTHINLLYSIFEEVKSVTSGNTCKEDETVCTGEDLFRIYKLLPVNHKLKFKELWLKELLKEKELINEEGDMFDAWTVLKRLYL